MYKTLLSALVLSFLTVSSSFANKQNPSDDPMKNTMNVYEQLVQIFTFSQPIDVVNDRATLNGWFSGRCYQAGSQEIARNHLRVGWFENYSSDEVYKSLAIRKGDGTNGGPDLFEHLTPQDRLDILNYLNSPYGKVKAEIAQFQDGSVIAKYISNYTENTFIHRKFLNFVVSKWYKDGNIFAYCYSFRKVN